MCNSEGISDTKVKCYKFTMLGQNIIFDNIDDLIENIKCDIENWDVGDKEDMSIEIVEVREDELDNLPEFEGY